MSVDDSLKSSLSDNNQDADGENGEVENEAEKE